MPSTPEIIPFNEDVQINMGHWAKMEVVIEELLYFRLIKKSTI